MTKLVEHVTPPEEDSEDEVKEVALCDKAELDIASAKKQSKIPFLDILQKEHDQWFYVLDADGVMPRSFNPSDYPGIKVSAIQLPPTQDSVVKIDHVFKELTDQCKVVNLERTPDVAITIRGDNGKKSAIVKGVILFRIKTHKEPRRR